MIRIKNAALTLLAAALLSTQGVAIADDRLSPPTEAADEFGGDAALNIWARELAGYVHSDVRVSGEFDFNGDAVRQLHWQHDIKNLVLAGTDGQEQAHEMAVKYRLFLTESQARAVIDDTYLACNSAQIAYHTCNQIVVALAPFERETTAR